MREFQPFTLEDLNISFIDGDRGKNYPSQNDFTNKGYCVFLNTKNVRKYCFDFSDVQYISKEKDSALRKGKIQDKDIILTTRGTVGNTAYYEQSIPYKNVRINSGMVIVRANEKIVDSHFLLYFLRSLDYDVFVSGSAQPQLPIRDLKKIEINLPPITEQKSISSVLSSLDNKIDLLHRQNKTLESMANTLFRQWFIKEAQDDWVEGTLSSIASNVRENVTKQNIPSEALYVGLEHIDRRNIALLKNGNGSDVDSNKSKFSTGDILFGKLRPYFHKVCTAPFDGICSTDILVIRPKNHNLQCFCLFAFFQDEVIEFANIASGGTRMPRIDWTSLANYPISLPPYDKLNDFEKIVSIQVRRINLNVHKIKNLENLRDTLLPKLMSGEVRVQYAEEAIASVA